MYIILPLEFINMPILIWPGQNPTVKKIQLAVLWDSSRPVSGKQHLISLYKDWVTRSNCRISLNLASIKLWVTENILLFSNVSWYLHEFLNIILLCYIALDLGSALRNPFSSKLTLNLTNISTCQLFFKGCFVQTKSLCIPFS